MLNAVPQVIVSIVESLECGKCVLKASSSWVLPFFVFLILPLFQKDAVLSKNPLSNH